MTRPKGYTGPRPDERWDCYYCPAGKYIRKADRHSCSRCKVNICDRHTFIRVDGANESITRNSPRFCAWCSEMLEPNLIAQPVGVAANEQETPAP